MKELMKVYGEFDLIRKGQDNSLKKVTYSSLDKYKGSPYLQKVLPGHSRKTQHHNSITPQVEPTYEKEREEAGRVNHLALPKLVTPMKMKETIGSNSLKIETDTKAFGRGPKITAFNKSPGSHSATLDITSKKKTLQPISNAFKMHYVMKTKAGTTGKQAKVNQDAAVIDMKLPFGLKLFCVCDGHGLNGHIVSAFIKSQLIKNLNSALKKVMKSPIVEEMKSIIAAALAKTNRSLLDSDINTQLSGSTVVAMFIYQGIILSFNIGDSRAILCRKIKKQLPEDANDKDLPQNHKLFEHMFKERDPGYEWKAIPLSVDQKPDRQDEKQRIISNGGRVFAQTDERGQPLGPLRVWMKEVQMPGLAMTRSFGDKAGLKAGTSSEPEVLEFELTPEDMFMVVASDGVWQYLQNEEVMRLVQPHFAKGELELGVERVVRVASEVWQKVSFSRDDITAIVVALHSPK